MTGPPRDRLLLLAFFCSGGAALGYELLWTRLLTTCLGSENLAVLGVLAGFFGGMVLGAYLLDGLARRTRSPVRLFVILELVAAGYALVSPQFLHWLARELPSRIGPLA